MAHAAKAAAAKAARPARGSRGRKAAPETEPRVRILDAAERLFGERGFYGASMRDIATMAHVVPSHVVYAFGTKEQLYAAALGRRIDELIAERAARRAIVEATKKPTLEALLESFVAPLLERAAADSEGWRHYGQLVAQVTNQRKTFELEAMNAVFDKLDASGFGLLQSIRKVVPGLGPRAALHGFLFFVSALLTIFAETGRLDRMSQGKYRSRDLAAQCAFLVPFCAGGFRALARGRVRPSSRQHPARP